MKKVILFGVIAIFLLTSIGIVMAAPDKNPNVRDPGTGKHVHFFTNDDEENGNRQVWRANPWISGKHAICMPKDRFSPNTLAEKISEGWYTSGYNESYICKWSN